MKKIILILSTFFFLGIIPQGFCADVAKIGVINFQKILKESSAGKMTQKQITEKGNEFQKKLKTEKVLLDEMKKAFEREALVLSPEKQQEKQREFRIRVNDFKKMQETFSREFKQLEVKLLNKIQIAVFEIANEIGKEEGYMLILEKKAAGVVYHPGQLDITDQIIKKYNIKVSKTN
ncbi:MAG: OmpH family outer membrane protein [Desulfobacula sp.]|uniref:OmpH family outer membrane protein n=1 Tax=Desulfobacula sp. TaxID=2593537 RepID=UPI0025B8ADD4|nr:OmpH family outer membrane protein [Desulfobacula sp.]MCD4721566.1 OmpH family outer membrane protein [Desulfobacula sp.]